MLEQGTGVPKDLERAFRLYRKACEGRYIPPCVDLGRLYAEGRGVKKDAAQAKKLLDWTCSIGYKEACGLLEKLSSEKRR